MIRKDYFQHALEEKNGEIFGPTGSSLRSARKRVCQYLLRCVSMNADPDWGLVAALEGNPGSICSSARDEWESLVS